MSSELILTIPNGNESLDLSIYKSNGDCHLIITKHVVDKNGDGLPPEIFNFQIHDGQIIEVARMFSNMSDFVKRDY